MGWRSIGNRGRSTAKRRALTQALTANGVENPAEVLKNVRPMAMQLERSSPELSHMARQNLAILHAAESELVAKINNWFDQTMDRTSQRFTASTRADHVRRRVHRRVCPAGRHAGDREPPVGGRQLRQRW